MKMYDNQYNLPRLPLPLLEDTCGKLLEWSRPLLSLTDYESSKESINLFMSAEGSGPFLQNKLHEFQSRKETLNWLEPFWFDSYLKNRAPLPIKSNVAFVLSKNCQTEKLPLAEFAASLLVSLFEYNDILKSENMEIDFQGKTPLCMSQYKTLLGTARIPGIEQDILRTDEDSKHIVIIAGGRYYLMHASDKDNKTKHFPDFYRAINLILEGSPPPNKISVGNLTSLDRPSWAKLRNRLKEIDPTNANSLDKIEGALAILALDQSEYNSYSAMFKSMLCGNSSNRWYDKSIQLILSKDGHFAVNYEHSGVDGTTLGNLVRYLHENMKAYELTKEEDSAINMEEIIFNLDSNIEKEIEKARIESDKAFDALSVETLLFKEFGKNLIKDLKVSPDSFIQLAFQAAQKKTFGKVENAYEAVMTKQFLHGRTEAMRPVTVESLAFVNNPGRSTLENAAAKHIERIIECKNGQGIERHLFGLMKMHEQHFPGKELPEIFDSPSYKSITRNFLSTSTSNPIGIILAGYGPAIADGYALRYLIYKDELHFVLSSMAHNEDSLAILKKNLNDALIEMASILEAE
jgi:carnitine O-acetyltransferase